MNYQNTLAFAKAQDKKDILKNYRKKFYFPQHKGKNVLYFCGNSLGLQPKTTEQYIKQELHDWANHGVEGHFDGKNPWLSYHEYFAKPVAKLVGAKPSEVVVMNQLTANIHFLLVSFYRPDSMRYKIICEQKAFPSDQYALESQVRFHGYEPDEAIIEVGPRPREHCIRTEDIVAAIERHKDELALVFWGGVNYYTGQVFDMKAITKAGHQAGAIVGYDLAHAAANIQLNLHNWDADFACWCSYKYLNSGPGSVGGVFIHEKHGNRAELPRFAGWWGHDKKTRFLMEKGFNPIKGAEGWQLSNAPVLSMAAHRASIDIFNEVGITKLVKKSVSLTGYLEFIIATINERLKKQVLEIITPSDQQARGCQLSIIAHGYGKKLHQQLTQQGIIADWREPNVIRVAPVPLYNSFEDVYLFGELLHSLLAGKK